MNRLGLFTLILIIFSGCSIKDVSKPIVKYTIDDDTKVTKERVCVDKIIKIKKFKSPDYIQNTNIWYKKPSYETSSYIYAQWNEVFVDLIEQNIATTIYDSGLFKSMFTRYSKIRSDLILEGEIIDARQIIKKDNDAEISFAIRAYLIDSKNSKLIDSKEFRYVKQCNSVDAKGAVIAYNDIVKNLNKDVRKWLEILVKEN